MFLNHIYNLFVLICISIIYTSKIFPYTSHQLLFCADLLSLHVSLSKKKRPDTSFLTKDLVKINQRWSFLARSILKLYNQKHARAHFWPIMLASWTNLFVKGFFHYLFVKGFFHHLFVKVFFHYLFVKGCNPFVKGCLEVLLSKTSVPSRSVRLMLFQEFLHSSHQIWIGIIL